MDYSRTCAHLLEKGKDCPGGRRRRNGFIATFGLIIVLSGFPPPAGQALAGAAPEPQFSNNVPHLDLAEGYGTPTARFLGFEVETTREGIPRFMVGFPTMLTTYWAVDSEPPDEATLLVRLKGSGPLVEQAYPLDVEGWGPGLSTRASVAVEVPRFTHAGNGVLSIGLRTSIGGAIETAEYYRGTSHTAQIVTTATFDLTRLEELFGQDAQPLRSSFRLARGARVPVTPRTPVERPCAGLGIVSALHYSHRFDQGEPIAEILVHDAHGAVQRVVIRAGVDTSLSEYDVPRPGMMVMKRGEIAASRPHPGDRLTWRMQPLVLYSYVGRLPFSEPLVPERLEVRYLSERGVIDVYEVVLLFDEESLRKPERAP